MPIDSQAGEDTLRADIAAQFDAMQDSSSSAPESPDPPQPAGDDAASAAADGSAADAPPSESTDGRARNADGTFKAKDKEAAPKEAAPAKESPAKDKPAVASEAPQSADAPPAGWPADAKAEWSKLSPALKAAVSKRETEISSGAQQWSEQRRNYERVLSPLAQEAAKLGLSVEQGLNSLLDAHHALNRDPVGTIRHLARQYGVDLATLAGPGPQNVSRETVEQPTNQQPDISALVRQAMEPILGPVQARFAAEDRRSQEMTLATVTSFAGAQGHEHFDAVQDELMALIPGIKAVHPSWSHEQVLQDAYDRAVYANPTTRAALLASQEKAAEEQRRAQARAHANGARRAASSVTGNAPGAPAAGPKDSLRDEIIAAMAGGG